MNTSQSGLDEFDASSPKHPKNSGRGKPLSEQTSRPKCGAETAKDSGTERCQNPVIPRQERCWLHLHADESTEDESEDCPVWERQKMED